MHGGLHVGPMTIRLLSDELVVCTDANAALKLQVMAVSRRNDFANDLTYMQKYCRLQYEIPDKKGQFGFTEKHFGSTLRHYSIKTHPAVDRHVR